MSNSYAIRFTFSEKWDLGDVNDFLTDYLNSLYYVIGCESGKKTGKEHCHIYARTDKKVEAIRKYLRSKGLKGNETFSIKVVKPDTCKQYMAYCCKEDTMPMFGMSVTDSDIDDIMTIKNSYVEDKKVKIDSKKKLYDKVKDYVFASGLYNEVYAKNQGMNINCTLRDIVLSTLVECVVKYFKEYDGLYREFQVVAICQTLMIKELDMGVVIEERLRDRLC